MELKVVCYCGQKYKFDVQPVDGRMPFTVACPVCGMDGTAQANTLLAEQLAGAMAMPVAAAEPAMAGGAGLRIPRPAAAPPPLAGAQTVPPPLSAPRAIAPIRPAVAAKSAPKEFSMGMGILGAFVGAALGAGLTYAFFMWVGFRFPWTGVGIGALSGYGARLMARGTDTTLGVIAAVIAGCSIVGVFFLMYGGFFLFGIISIVICIGLAYRLASE